MQMSVSSNNDHVDNACKPKKKSILLWKLRVFVLSYIFLCREVTCVHSTILILTFQRIKCITLFYNFMLNEMNFEKWN